MAELLPSNKDIERDALEQQIAAERDRPQIHWERRYGLEIAVYYTRSLGGVTLELVYADHTRSFTVDDDKVNDAIAHPEFYAAMAGLPRLDRRGDE